MKFQDASNRAQIPYAEDAAPGSGKIASGDMLFWSSPNVAALSSSANSSSFVGVCKGQRGTDGRIEFHRGGAFRFKETSGEVYTPRQALYVGTDPQTVTNVVSGTSIGYVAFDQGDAALHNQVVAVIEPAL